MGMRLAVRNRFLPLPRSSQGATNTRDLHVEGVLSLSFGTPDLDLCSGNQPIPRKRLITLVDRNLPVDRTGTQKNPEGQGSPIRGVLVRRDSNNFPGRPQSAERLASPNGSKTSQRRGSGLAVASTERQRRQMEETQEQLVALARGGVRYAGKVFHRKGVKLTEDSPRSMLPRNVSQSIL